MFVQSIEARCQVENEYIVGGEPTARRWSNLLEECRQAMVQLVGGVPTGDGPTCWRSADRRWSNLLEECRQAMAQLVGRVPTGDGPTCWKSADRRWSNLLEECRQAMAQLVGGVPTGDGPTISGWSTILLPAKLRVIFGVRR